MEEESDSTIEMDEESGSRSNLFENLNSGSSPTISGSKSSSSKTYILLPFMELVPKSQT
jgi:hypothetical protein